MTTQMHEDGHDPKIVRLTVAEDQTQATTLARYWDATVRGQPADPGTLDPELATVVALLRHYHTVTRLQHDDPALTGASPPHPVPARRVTRTALAMIGVFALIFALNTLLSPRSWLLSSAEDPDWIPWVSDDWLGDDAMTSRFLAPQMAERLGQHDWMSNGG